MLTAGFGFRAAATVESLRDALERASGGRPVSALAAPADKAGAPCLTALAGTLGLPVTAVAGASLRAQPTPTQAPRVLAMRGTGSVAEAAALAAAGARHGTEARLLGPRCLSADRLASCAVATCTVAGPLPAGESA